MCWLIIGVQYNEMQNNNKLQKSLLKKQKNQGPNIVDVAF